MSETCDFLALSLNVSHVNANVQLGIIVDVLMTKLTSSRTPMSRYSHYMAVYSISEHGQGSCVAEWHVGLNTVRAERME